jgi:hypothetical protein
MVFTIYICLFRQVSMMYVQRDLYLYGTFERSLPPLLSLEST